MEERALSIVSFRLGGLLSMVVPGTSDDDNDDSHTADRTCLTQKIFLVPRMCRVLEKG